jgi:rubrerythrin
MIIPAYTVTGVNGLLSKIPVDLKKVSEGDIDKEILRAGIIAELDAVNLYEQMASLTKNANIRAVLLDVAKEEKTHIGEFQALLLQFDPQQKQELEAGAEELEEKLSK